MKTKLRLMKKTVRFVAEIDGKLRLAGIGSDSEVVDMDKSCILNLDEINLMSDHFIIVIPEQIGLSRCNGVTFTREIDLPR